MADDINTLTERAENLQAELDTMYATWGTDRSQWAPGQVARSDRLIAGIENARAAVFTLEDSGQVQAPAEPTRAERIEAIREAVRAGTMRMEAGSFVAPSSHGAVRERTDPWAAGDGDNVLRVDSPVGLLSRARTAAEVAPGLTEHARGLLTDVLDRDDDPRASALVLAGTAGAYRSAFEKLFNDEVRGHLLFTPEEREAYARVETARAALGLSVQGGGLLVPFTLDSSVQLTNAGTANPFRQMCRVETTATNTWNGTVSTGANAEWLAEGAEAADATPTFERVTVTPNKGAAWIVASFEVDEDAPILASTLGEMIQDARDRLEATAFATGTDGVVTTVTAVTGSRVSPATGGAFVVGDIYKVWNALTPRARRSTRTAWLSNVTIQSTIRQFDTAGSSSFWTDLGGATPPTLLGKPIHESSDMVSTVTTGSNILLAGDFYSYLIVDRLGVVVTPVGMNFGDNKRPNFTRGWAAHWRTAGKPTDTGAFRVLKL